ncbi:hypothetical protein BD779DRAFT_37301 [Infundibulicybe gibba]|nr:hypothetical protein BD779DRAFT_37301 [Infundibulicybe gibba]
MTSTITDRPESTFKSVIAITSVNPTDGKTATITPDFLTVLSTSTEPDGSFVTFTHIVANPTGLSDTTNHSTTGFLHNQGAVAGVFVVVGILAAVLVVGGAFFCRRRRRLNRRRRWLAGLRQQPPMTGNPFDDPPVIRTAQSDHARDEMVWDGRATHNLNNDVSFATQGMAGVGTGTRGSTGSHDTTPFSDNREYRPNLGLILSTDRNNMSRPSFAQSSPSIYPPSLPPADDTYDLIDTRTPVNNTFVVPVPPRPPRSHLRNTASKGVDYIPLTPPPSSISSHPSDKPPSPIEDIIKSLETFPDRYPQTKQHPQPDTMFTRRTLLDVRPRSRDNIDP